MIYRFARSSGAARRAGPGQQAVSTSSACNAWAVGRVELSTLIEHWVGKIWQVHSSPDGVTGAGTLNQLTGVTAISNSSVWAVGYDNNAVVNQTLIEHWNGKFGSSPTNPAPTALRKFFGPALPLSVASFAGGLPQRNIRVTEG